MVVTVRGYIGEGRIIVQADDMDATLTEIMEHELGHAEETAELNRTVVDLIRERFSLKEFEAIMQTYADNLQGYTEEELISELVQNARAGINAFGQNVEQYQETVRETYDRARENAVGQDANGVRETRGPDGRWSIGDNTTDEGIQREYIDYRDKEKRNSVQTKLHNKMVSDGKTINLAEYIESVSRYFPDLRSMKKRERNIIISDNMRSLKNDLREYLSQLKEIGFEFEIKGKTIEARLYSTGINEVLKIINQEKAGMLGASEEIFRNAEYLYSTHDADGDPNISEWDYFYTPVSFGDETEGVRIAIRNMKTPEDTQIYNWGIKKEETSLDGVGHLLKSRPSNGVSSDASSAESLSETFAESKKNLNRGETEVDRQHMELAREPEANAAELQRMVDEAAKKAGYTKRMFHQTEAKAITVFDISRGDHGGTDPETPYGVFTKRTNADIGLGGTQMKLFVQPGKTIRFKNREELHNYFGGESEWDHVKAGFLTRL